MLASLSFCLIASVVNGAWTFDYPAANESFTTSTRIPGYGDAQSGGVTYTYRFRKSGTTYATKTRTTIISNPPRWENVYIDSTSTFELEPPGSPPAWPCGAATVEIYYDNQVQVSRAIDITDSGCQ